ncbi:Ig-like domain-containing protein [bacterium]|nr:Ig-like domain-containing protein [bacterium]
MGKSKTVLKAQNNAELLSYIINQDPVLSANIDLPVQGQDIKPIGQLIVSNQRYKNAFLNVINVIGLTVIDRNTWENPWEEFTNRGQLNYGQTVRELFVDIADVFDYNTYATDVDHFLENVVPNVYEYLHELNFQKFYKTTTSDEQIAMAFNSEDGLFELIDRIVSSLYEAYKYDRYIVDKYQLCRRIVDGTLTSIYIDDYATLTPRERVAKIKNVSNLMGFRSPNYNPAGVRVATSYDNQRLIMNTDFYADFTTSVLSTSFFINEADFKTKMALADGFGNHDTARLVEVLGDQYVPFTSTELQALAKIPAVLIDDEFFQDYFYSFDNNAETRATEFFNPETLKTNHWLHVWMVLSTSPFKNGAVITQDQPAVTSVVVSPSSATLSQGSELQMKAIATTTGFANKSVVWSVSTATGVSIDEKTGLLKASASASTGNVTVTATSVFDSSVTGTATITIGSSTEPSITSVTVTAEGGATSVAKGSTLQLTATVVGDSDAVIWETDNASILVTSDGLVVVPSETTAESVTVTATSALDDTVSDDITLTITAE